MSSAVRIRSVTSAGSALCMRSRQEDGSAVSFVNTAGNYVAAARSYDATLVKNVGSYLYSWRGNQFFTFAATGDLTAETDLAGTDVLSGEPSRRRRRPGG